MWPKKKKKSLGAASIKNNFQRIKERSLGFYGLLTEYQFSEIPANTVLIYTQINTKSFACSQNLNYFQKRLM